MVFFERMKQSGPVPILSADVTDHPMFLPHNYSLFKHNFLCVLVHTPVLVPCRSLLVLYIVCCALSPA